MSLTCWCRSVCGEAIRCKQAPQPRTDLHYYYYYEYLLSRAETFVFSQKKKFRNSARDWIPFWTYLYVNTFVAFVMWGDRKHARSLWI